jgi:hypothetical protein
VALGRQNFARKNTISKHLVVRRNTEENQNQNVTAEAADGRRGNEQSFSLTSWGTKSKVALIGNADPVREIGGQLLKVPHIEV